MMHLKRWLTGIIALPLLIYIIGPGPVWLFQLLIISASLIAFHEFLDFSTPGLPLPLRILGFLFAYFLIYIVSRGLFFVFPLMILMFVILFLSIFLLAYPSRRPHALEDIGKIFFGLAYTSLPLSLLVFISNHPKGDIWIFLLLSIIFAGDTGAFYFGRVLGKHKLYPSVSPGKTWEGAFGGLLSSILVALLFARFFPYININLPLLSLAAVLSIFGQVGDLAESMLKRNYGVKDSGGILPGHGGILDRIDGLLFAIPVLYIYLSWIQ